MSKKGINRLIAIAVTLLIHLLFVGLLFLLKVGAVHTFSTPTKEITLLPVGMYGTGEAAGGGVQREDPAPHPVQAPSPSASRPKSTPKKELLTRESSNPVLEAQAQREQQKKQQEVEAKQREQARKQEEINAKMAGAFGRGTGKSPKNDAGSGTGGSSAVGSGFSLSGRSIEGSGGRPVRPQGFPPTRGTVVVSIVVDNMGKVIEATTRLRGTSVTDQRTINAALRAARKTQFNKDMNAPRQEGTITYNFDVK